MRLAVAIRTMSVGMQVLTAAQSGGRARQRKTVASTRRGHTTRLWHLPGVALSALWKSADWVSSTCHWSSCCQNFLRGCWWYLWNCNPGKTHVLFFFCIWRDLWDNFSDTKFHRDKNEGNFAPFLHQVPPRSQKLVGGPFWSNGDMFGRQFNSLKLQELSLMTNTVSWRDTEVDPFYWGGILTRSRRCVIFARARQSSVRIAVQSQSAVKEDSNS